MLCRDGRASGSGKCFSQGPLSAARDSAAFQRRLWREATDAALEEVASRGVEVSRPDKAAFAAATEGVRARMRADPQLGPLLALGPVNLAVSLHATTDALRDVLVPLNRRYPLERLLGELRRLETVNRRRPVFFEYTLIDGVNDRFP